MVHNSHDLGGMTCRLILAALAAAAAVPWASAWAFELRTDPSGSPVRFAEKAVVFRLPAKLPPGLEPAEVKEALESSLAAWSAISGLELRAEPGSADAVPGYDAARGNHNDILFAMEEWPWEARAVAVTLMTVDANAHAVLDADIVLNARQHRFKKLDAEDASGSYDDLQNVLTHELGHALGLGHSARSDAAMFSQTIRGEVNKRALSPDDHEGVRALYPAAANAAGKEGASEPTAGRSASGSAPAAGAAAAVRPRSAHDSSRLGGIGVLGFRASSRLRALRRALRAGLRAPRPCPCA